LGENKVFTQHITTQIKDPSPRKLYILLVQLSTLKNLTISQIKLYIWKMQKLF